MTCKYNERVALNVAETKAFVEQNNIVTLKADKTGDAPQVDEILQKLGGSAIPYYAIFSPAAPEKPIVLDGVITTGKVIKALQQALSRTDPGSTAGQTGSSNAVAVTP